ncbi:MAG: Ribosomal protein HS6-type [Thermoanaerobacterales bacterium 50_218]|nr:MAG: Ribosomal protein HS6-type [Thermoanaerobacterales bacterium 50_218]HAA89863.1 50S ribosomal protein L7Ae-like protein [Peptococcaceae bacterium]
MERLKNAQKRVVGTKQTKKAVEKGIAQLVYVAKDAEEHVTSPLLQLCSEKGVEVVMVDSMAELGKACGIKVGAASAAILS